MAKVEMLQCQMKTDNAVAFISILIHKENQMMAADRKTNKRNDKFVKCIIIKHYIVFQIWLVSSLQY